MIILEDTIAVQLVRAWDGDEIANLYRAGGWWKEEYDPKELSRLILGSFLFVVASDLKTGRAVGMGRVIADGVSDGYIQDLVGTAGIPENRDRRPNCFNIGKKMR